MKMKLKASSPIKSSITMLDDLKFPMHCNLQYAAVPMSYARA